MGQQAIQLVKTSASNIAAPLSIFFIALLVCAKLFLLPDWNTFDDANQWYLFNWSNRYPYLLESFRDSYFHGIFYPRWIPTLMGGNGYPTFLFYPPGVFFFGVLFSLVIPNLVLAAKISVLAFLFLGGYGAYLLCRLFCGKAAAIAASALYLFTPFLYIDLYLRADHAEVFAMLLCPWCAYFAFRLYFAFRENTLNMKLIYPFILSLAALLWTHPMVGFHFTTVLVFLAVGMWKETTYNWRLPLIFALSFLAAATLSAPYWITAIQMRDEVNYAGILFTYLIWLRPIGEQLLSNPASNLFVLFGFWTQRRSTIAWCLFAAWLFFFYLNCPAAKVLWDNFAPLRWTQLPFRILCVEALLRLISFSFLFHYLETRPRLSAGVKIALMVIVVSICTIAAMIAPLAHPVAKLPLNFQTINSRIIPANALSLKQYADTHYEELSHAHDFIPKRVNLQQLQKEIAASKPLAWTEPGQNFSVKEKSGSSIYHMLLNVNVPESCIKNTGPAILHIRQLYLNGWCVRINSIASSPVEDDRADAAQELRWGPGADDRVLIKFSNQAKSLGWQWEPAPDARIWIKFLKAGVYDVDIFYGGPPFGIVRNMIMLVILVGLYFAIQRLLPKRN